MASKSLQALKTSLSEIHTLRDISKRYNDSHLSNPELFRAVGRAAIVLLYSHFEKYFYGVNEEIADFINSNNVAGNNIPLSLRLLHSKPVVEGLSETEWTKRANKLENFVITDCWLWSRGTNGELIPDRLLEWMKSANPSNIMRYYKYWGIEDIFTAITRAPHTRSNLWLQISTLVDKRHNIAHGDATVEANRSELGLYSQAVLTFCERADRILSKQIQRLLMIPAPW